MPPTADFTFHVGVWTSASFLRFGFDLKISFWRVLNAWMRHLLHGFPRTVLMGRFPHTGHRCGVIPFPLRGDPCGLARRSLRHVGVSKKKDNASPARTR